MFALAILSLSDDSQWNIIARKTIENSNVRIPDMGPALRPQMSSSKGFTYTVKQRIVGQRTTGVRGAHLDPMKRFLGLYGPQQSSYNQHVYADPYTQCFYWIRNKVMRLSGVDIYAVEKADLLDVIDDIHLQTAPQTGYDCQFVTDDKYPGYVCRAHVGVNWPYVAPNQDPRKMMPNRITHRSGLFSYAAGAYAQASAGLSFKLSKRVGAELDLDLDVSAVGGLGFYMDQTISYSRILLGEKCIPVYGFNFAILGIRIEIGLQVCVEIDLKNIGFTMPAPISIERKIAFNVHDRFILTKSGLRRTPITYKIDIPTIPDINMSKIFNFIKGTKFNIEPAIYFGPKVGIRLGSYTYSEAKVDFSIDVNFDFHPDTTRCRCPYLYGLVNTDFNGDFDFTGINIFGHQIIRPYNVPFDIYDYRSPSFCLGKKK